MTPSHSDLASRIKEAVSVPALLEREGLTPRRDGFLRCPLHEGDRSPSFKVYPDGQSWYCFGCHRGGDVISLAMALYETDFRGAVRTLDQGFALGLGRSGERQTEPQRRSADLAAWKRRREAEDRELEHRLDEWEWARCNDFIHTWPHWLNPWPWCWAIARRDCLAHRLENYERGGD